MVLSVSLSHILFTMMAISIWAVRKTSIPSFLPFIAQGTLTNVPASLSLPPGQVAQGINCRMQPVGFRSVIYVLLQNW